MERPTKEQISQLPLYIGLGLHDIIIVENELDAAQAITALKNETSIGFDTESKPIFQKGQVSPGPSLIQLATESKAFLFPVRFLSAVAAAKEILENPKIKKIGFGIKDDNKELRNKLNIDITNTQDLSVTLKQLAGEKNSIGARAAVAMVLGKRLGKGAQKSNWGAYPLKENQILYAANDAHSAICVERALVLLR
ncbi:3'-5' exonuclease domain-containing protein 2 [Marinomonas rhizomae]|uniref:3'-5' exonuclease n=1 Tax=Marinomonas rhizomae TaxID=491948 RepID=UPI0021050750|nr:3'-5' exonuclease [Marinomonas rhizomae]UTW00696.1 3'-5' exonuclease domain-containing protein 2 [Marinomonas rhizomae]